MRHRRSNFVHAHRLHLLEVFPSLSTPPFAGVGLLIFGGVLSVLRETRHTNSHTPLTAATNDEAARAPKNPAFAGMQSQLSRLFRA